jgi:hypothetical protein
MHRRLPSRFGDTIERGVNTGQRISGRDRLPKARRSRFICDGVEHGCGVHVAWARVARLCQTEASPPCHDPLRVERSSKNAKPSGPAAIPSGVSITACRRPNPNRIMSPFDPTLRLGRGAGALLALAVPTVGRATNRARMSCAGRLKQVFDLDIEHCPTAAVVLPGTHHQLLTMSV